MQGKTQSYARCLNNRLVMRELRSENCSATMLSRKLNLSNAALSAIIDELKKHNYIKEVDGDSEAFSGVGRRPVYYAVNERFGCVAVVSLSDDKAKVVLGDMRANIMCAREIRVETYDVATLYELVLMLKNLLSEPQYRDVPLMGIDLSMPGRVNTLTDELMLSPQFDKAMFNERGMVSSLFQRQFNVPVVLNNDVNLACAGEMHKGLLKDVDNGMLAHVDLGIGGALVLGGKLYTGAQGYAGEVGLIHTEFMGQSDALDEFVSLRAIKNYVKSKLGRKVHTADVVEMYKTESWVKEYVDSTARCLGKVLKDVVELLDVNKIVISGRVKLFGDDYFAAVNAEVAKSINNCTVVPSHLGASANVIGAIAKAVENLTDHIFKE